MEQSFALGVDIGGTHITAAMVDLKKGELIESSVRRKMVNSKESAAHILNAWCETILTVLNDIKKMPIDNIGIAIPGPFDYEKGISWIIDQDKFQFLYGINIKKELSKRLNTPLFKINFMNDAAAFLQGEVFNDPSLCEDVTIGLTLGTGLGSAICENGNAKDAELWDSPFKNGIAEDFLSSRWFIHRYKEMSGMDVVGVKELFQMTEHKKLTKSIFKEFGENLAYFLLPLIQKYKVKAIILGGNISGASSVFKPYLQDIIEADGTKVEIKITQLKENAALVGAACYLTMTNQQIIK